MVLKQDDTITVNIHQSKFLHNIIVLSIFFFVWIFLLAFTETEVGGILSFFILLSAILAYCFYYDKKPTVIFSDRDVFRYKHILKEREIKISDIKSVQCAPYEVHIRYTTQQRIMLRIKFKDEDRECIEFNDKLDSSGLLNEKLGGKKSDIPLLDLYNFLRVRI